MLNITIKYFASLREKMGKNEECMTLDKATSVADLWKKVATTDPSEDVLMAINMEYVRSDTIVKDGDEIAFFPPVTGG